MSWSMQFSYYREQYKLCLLHRDNSYVTSTGKMATFALIY